MSWLDKLKNGLKKTSSLFSFKKWDSSMLEDLEDSLLMADVGVATTTQFIETIKEQKPCEAEEVKALLRKMIAEKLESVARPLTIPPKKPFVILMAGVNGAGKTTTIGKLAHLYKEQGKKVALVAADTFRAGAVQQLSVWGERLNIPVFTTKAGGDAAGLVFDALKKATAEEYDILFIDTAGRLQNKADLMRELEKVVRVMQKLDATVPHETILVLDATVGQNAISQVQAFMKILPVTGLIMTKLDGTAKGGILLSLTEKFSLPIYALGIGEQITDLQSFTAADYAAALWE